MYNTEHKLSFWQILGLSGLVLLILGYCTRKFCNTNHYSLKGAIKKFYECNKKNTSKNNSNYRDIEIGKNTNMHKETIKNK
jgi:hypothetical protein